MNQGWLKVTGVAVWLFAATAQAQAPTGAEADAPKVERAPDLTPPDATGSTAVATSPTPPPAPTVFLTPEGWPIVVPPGANRKVLFYGFAEFDIMRDSTQSFANDGSNNGSVARPNTVPGDNAQSQFTPRNSRLGIKLESSPYHSMTALAQAEMDFYGNQASGASEGAIYTNAPIRMRHYFLTLRTPVVDVIAGQYHDLFAWGGSGFFPNTVAFLGLPGEIYHRNPQLRLTKTLKSNVVDLEIAVAAVRPVGRAGEIPDGEGGIRLAFNRWKGVRAQGSGPPDAGPLAIGLSGVGRRFRVNPFSATPGDYKTATGWGVAGNVVLPIIPCTKDDMRNAVTITGEATMGTGIADLYSGLTGGAVYPALPNPMNLIPPPVYNRNLDPGIVAFDDQGARANIHPINWRGLVAGLQYHLPVGMGKTVWISGIYSLTQSTNLESLTPDAAKPTIWTKAQYFDGNIFVAVTPTVQFDVSYQVTMQTYADVDPTNGANTRATNNRGELAMHYFF
jgi:hypothetical protein